MNETLKIKPCPHCGGDATLYCNYSGKQRKYLVFVKCEICGAQGKVFSDSQHPEETNWNNAACDSAIKAWNMRTTDKEINTDEQRDSKFN